MSVTPPEVVPPIESPSILVSTKAALGITPEQHAFDSMVVMHINSVLSTLEQLGVGPAGGLMVTSEAQTWSDLIGADNRLNMAKSYMYMRVRMMYDPPDIGFVITAMKDEIKEMEWRLNVFVDNEVDTPLPEVHVIDGGEL